MLSKNFTLYCTFPRDNMPSIVKMWRLSSINYIFCHPPIGGATLALRLHISDGRRHLDKRLKTIKQRPKFTEPGRKMENGKRKAEGACCCLSELTAGGSCSMSPVPCPLSFVARWCCCCCCWVVVLVVVVLVVLSCRRSRANKLRLLSIFVTLIKFIFKQRAT